METKMKFDKNRDEFHLIVNEKSVYTVRLTELLWYSVGRPWNPVGNRWRITELQQEENCILAVLSSQELEASVQLKKEDQEIRISVMFRNGSEKAMDELACGMKLSVRSGEKQKVTIPHLIYNDNPSADPNRVVPHIGTVNGKGTVVEEHRLPIPAVNVEWKEEEAFYSLTLLSVPETENGTDEEYWSLGACKTEGGYQILSASGPLMFNGMSDVFYGGRCTPLSYMKGYRRLGFGETIHKVYYLRLDSHTKEGRGFTVLPGMGYRLLHPQTVPMYSCEEMVHLKKNVLDSRFYEEEGCCGYLTFGDKNPFGNISGRPEYFLYGWTGQAIRLAWCDCMLGIRSGEPFRLQRAMKTVDHFLKNGECRIPGLYLGYYLVKTGSWQGSWNDPGTPVSSRIEGESISDVLDVMLLLKEQGTEVPKLWEDAVKRVCEFLMREDVLTSEGLYPLSWTMEGRPSSELRNAAGAPCVAVLAKAYQYFGQKTYLEQAQRRYERYAEIYMSTFETPFAYATMDAACEDKEAGIYMFTTAALLYEITGNDGYREWGTLTADWILTFVYHWETGFRPGTLCAQKKFRTTGWPGVSVQNHHLDVFFPVYELYRFGRICKKRRLTEMASHIGNALTCGIASEEGEWGYSVIGEQGEQYYQTNYFQVMYPQILQYLERYRGGMQVWNPSWITAQVMSANLRFLYEDR